MPEDRALPLVVDLDGTLTRTDTLAEALFRLAREQPLALIHAAFTLRQGRAAFKARIARLTALDPSTLPLPGTPPGFIQQRDPVADGLVAVPRPQPDAGRNISYAVQWLLFAAVALVGWWYFLRREAADDAARRTDEHAPAAG